MTDEHDTVTRGDAEPSQAPEVAAAPEAPIAPATPTGLPAFPEPKVTVKTNVNMHFKSVDASGKVTEVDVDPKAAKRLLYGGIALLVISALVIFAATILLLGRLFG